MRRTCRPAIGPSSRSATTKPIRTSATRPLPLATWNASSKWIAGHTPRLLDLDVVGLDHLGPALGFAADLLAQPLGRAADQAQPGFFQAGLDARVADGRVERRIQALDRRARTTLRHHETVPGFDDEALVAQLFHGGHIRKVGRAPRSGYRQGSRL